MKKLFKVFGIIAISAIIVFSATGCDTEGGSQTITITGLTSQQVSPPNYKLIKAEIHDSNAYDTASLIATSGDWANIEEPRVILNLDSAVDPGSYYVKLTIQESRVLLQQNVYFSTVKVTVVDTTKDIRIAFGNFGKDPVEVVERGGVDPVTGDLKYDDKQLYTFKSSDTPTHTEVEDGDYDGTYGNWGGYYVPASGGQAISTWLPGSKVEVDDNKITVDLGSPAYGFGNFLGKTGLYGIVISEFNNGTNIIDYSKDGSNRIVFIWVDDDASVPNYTRGKSKFDNLTLKKGWNEILLEITSAAFTYKNITTVPDDYKWTVW